MFSTDAIVDDYNTKLLSGEKFLQFRKAIFNFKNLFQSVHFLQHLDVIEFKGNSKSTRGSYSVLNIVG